MKLEKDNTNLPKILLIIVVILVTILSPKPNNSPEPMPIPNNSTFDQISQVDQSRMKDIIMGVIQNTISVTPELKKELRDIFKKYNMTDTEIDNFATYGPAFAGIWNQHFFLDAFEAVSSGTPVKSDERANLEKEALSRGLMTTERIKLNDEKMILIASHQPVAGLDGKEIILTVDNIKSNIDNLSLIVDRLVLLFK